MMKDPIVEEMRNAGRKIQEECDNDWDKFAQRIQENEKKLRAEGWKFADNLPIQHRHI
jgi:hypothetical protein